MSTPRRMIGSRHLWGAAGIVFSALILAVFLHRLDWGEFVHSLEGLRVGFVMAGGALFGASIFLRSGRWRLLARLENASIATFWFATLAGYVGSTIYPARAGELLRVLALHEGTRAEPARLVASAVLDRACDVIVLAGFGLAIMTSLSVDESLRSALLTLVVAATAVAGVLLAMVNWRRQLSGFSHRLLGEAWGSRWHRAMRWSDQTFSYFESVRNSGVLVGACAFSVAATLLDYSAIWLCLTAMGWKLPFLAAGTVGVFVALGSLLPAAPGYIGIYQIAAVLALGLFGVAEPSALAFSVVLQVTALSVIGVLGLWVIAHFGWKLRRPQAE